MLKSKIAISRGKGGHPPSNFWYWVQKCWSPKFPFSGGGVIHLPTFDAESKNAEIQNCHFWGGGGRGSHLPSNFWSWVQKYWNPKFPFPGGGHPPSNFWCWGGGVGHQLPNSNLKFSKSNPELKFPFPGGGGGGQVFYTIGMFGIWCCHLACI